MKNLSGKRIIDERMEFQSLKNAKKAWVLTIILLGLSILIKLFIIKIDLIQVIPEFAILMISCIYNLILDTRDGNLYTSDYASPRKNLTIYLTASLITGIFCGIGSYQIQQHTLLISLFSGFLSAISAAIGMLLLEHLIKKTSNRNLEKKSNSQENQE